jgi:hypothetical protein
MRTDTIPRYLAEYQDKAAERHHNDMTLLPRLAEIQHGQAVEVLARFAKAYLGLFLEMDNSIPPAERITILASPTLAAAVWQGTQVVLQQGHMPTAPTIAASLLREQPLDIGYVILAGMYHCSAAAPAAVLQLPAPTLSAAVCFYYANKTGLPTHWLEQVIAQRQALLATTLQEFWLYLIDHGIDYLPGLMPVLQAPANQPIARAVVLPILSHWHHCRCKVLREILLAALQVADQQEFRRVATTALANWNPQEPARYALWLGAAYLLDPDNTAPTLTEYLGRSRERILPLLDFVVLALQNDTAARYQLSAAALALLLRNIAPKFTPQEDPHGNLCDNTLRVMYLFYRLASSTDPHTAAVVTQLAQVRVMKLYSAILQTMLTPPGNRQAQAPGFETFVEGLHQAGHIHGKRNWSDLR